MEARTFEQFVHGMTSDRAEMVLAIVEQVVASASARSARLAGPAGRMDLARFAQVWASDWLVRAADGAIDTRALRRDLEAAVEARLSAEAGETSRTDSEQEETLALVEHFLRTGHPPAAGAALPWMAGRDSSRLGTLVRKLAREKPEAALELTDRLLGWLLPDELLEALAPGEGDHLLAHGRAPWRELVVALLRDAPPVPRPEDLSWATALDLRALAGAWLDAGDPRMEAEAPVRDARSPRAGDRRGPSDGVGGPTGVGAALNALPDLSLAELIDLFVTEDEETTAGRVWRGLQALGVDRGEALLAKIAPWATRPGGPLAATMAPLDAARRLEVLSRAAAASLAGGSVDLAGLGDPCRRPRRPPPPSSRHPGGRCRRRSVRPFSRCWHGWTAPLSTRPRRRSWSVISSSWPTSPIQP